MEQPLGRNSSVGAEGRASLGGNRWLAAFLCFIIVLTTAGNSLLIALIFTQRSLRNTSNFFLVSLFAADLLVGLVVMPPAMLNQLCGRWVLERPFCSLWHSFDVMCCSASILNLCAISLDRYLLILCPLQYKLRMGPRRALCLILAAWSLAALASFLPITMDWHELEFDVRTTNNTSTRAQDQCRLLVSLPYALVASCLTFFLPSVAISFTYCRILLAAKKQAVQVAALTANMTSSGEEHSQVFRVQNPLVGGGENRRYVSKHSKKALKASLTLGILLGMFFIAWLPFFVANVAQAVCDCVPDSLFDVLTWLGYCNSTMNPIIYPLFMRDFKRAMAKYLPCCRRSSEHRSSAISLSIRNSNSGQRLGLSLKNMLNLRGDPDSMESITQANEQLLLPHCKDHTLDTLPATGADSVNLFDFEQTDHELQVHQLNTPMD
ncbi:5-hydroxytryptamine receptor 6 [Ambystoma mexicanum]|uniref:5-hydroxytryptamine receptor 6 n=1 Tax=Ambystoma mexicanum TaxID=8296 RepID=UPI0037E7747E